MKVSNVKIESDGTGACTFITVNGAKVEGVQAIAWKCKAGEMAEAHIVVTGVAVETNGPHLLTTQNLGASR